MIYTLTLNPAIDYFMIFDQDISSWQKTANFEYFPGGKGINASILLNNLKQKNIAVFAAGGNNGQKFIELCKKRNINIEPITTDQNLRINVKSNYNGKIIEQNVQGYKIDGEKLQEKVISFFNKKLKKGDIVMIMGSVPTGLSFVLLEKIISEISHKKAQLVFDLSGKYINKLLKYKPLLIKPNRFELETLVNKKMESIKDIVSASKNLIKKGAQNVLVSMDKDGSIFINRKHVYRIDPIKIKEVNSSGAGDSMIAGAIYGFYNGYLIEDTLKLATAAGTATAASKEIALKQDIDKLIKKIKIKELKHEK